MFIACSYFITNLFEIKQYQESKKVSIPHRINPYFYFCTQTLAAFEEKHPIASQLILTF